MAGEIGTDTALKVLGWAAGGIAYGASLIVYVKLQLKQDRQDINELKGRTTNLESTVATGVRPQDIQALREDIKEIRSLLLSKR